MERTDTFYHIYTADSLIRKNVRKGIGDVKLTPGVINILDFLGHHDDVIQKDISEFFHEEPASITSSLKYMERIGLIERSEHKRDGRAKSISLTPKGKQVQTKVAGLYLSIRDKGLKGFSREELTLLDSFMKRICINLEGVIEDASQ